MESFQTNLFHEMTHSTGVEGRLNRIVATQFGSSEYAAEELKAELTAAFVAANYGMVKGLKTDSAPYLKSWLDSLHESPNFLKTILLDVKRASSMLTQRIDGINNRIEQGLPPIAEEWKNENKQSQAANVQAGEVAAKAPSKALSSEEVKTKLDDFMQQYYFAARRENNARLGGFTEHEGKPAIRLYIDSAIGTSNYVITHEQDALKQERLIVEVASGIKMLELGLPARLSEESLKTVEYWNRELQENPLMMAAIESDVNNALEVIRKAERGEKIEYATIRNRRQTSDMRAELPKHHAIADEIARHPDKDKKTIIVVRDNAAKTADVVLPAGASTEVDNEVPGMNKSRIERALRKEGFEQIRFFNPDGALGFRPDDSYFSGKEVSLARLKNWEIQELSTLDVAPAVKQACEVSFDRVQMIQDDKNRWALYIKPENESGYSVYPDKEDVNRFFSTLKQAMDNIDKVRMELAHKYYALAETKPDLKVDLFSCGADDADLSRIQRVSVFKTKKDGILCAATIDGRRLEPRSITQQQWQRMWLAEDRDGYKLHLAASLFSDVMRQGQVQGNAPETGSSVERQQELREEEQTTGLKR